MLTHGGSAWLLGEKWGQGEKRGQSALSTRRRKEPGVSRRVAGALGQSGLSPFFKSAQRDVLKGEDGADLLEEGDDSFAGVAGA